MASSVLVLWDVDHTLLTSGGLSRELYDRALRRVTGRPLGELADMAGRTEQAIALDTLRLNGIPDGGPLLPAVYAALTDAAVELADAMRECGHALPGAREALVALAADGAIQTVVTGNIRTVAHTKLTAFDLTAHLDLAIGGYGDDGTDRADLIRHARTRAEVAHRRTFAPDHVVVIGDTPHDIRGAHNAGVRAIGVPTGRYTAADLAAATAAIAVDLAATNTANTANTLLPDLTNLIALRAAVFTNAISATASTAAAAPVEGPRSSHR